MRVTGQFYPKNQSQSYVIEIEVNEHNATGYHQGDVLFSNLSFTQGPHLSGLPIELLFSDGTRFVPDDASNRWANTSPFNRFLDWVHSHTLALVGCVITAAAVLWFLFAVAVPALSVKVAKNLPDSVVSSVSKQSLQAIEWSYLEPSTLPATRQQGIRYIWQEHIKQLPDAPNNLRLYFYSAPALGANAFALPGGEVVVTDELVRLLDGNDMALLAILLHEIGHVHHQHGLTLAAQSAGTTALLALLVGDVEGIAEILLGTGSSLLQQHFSRDMEREADLYALSSLKAMHYNSHSFIDAMQALGEAHGVGEKQDVLMDYLSSHPGITERIEQARQFDTQQTQ